MTSPFGLRPIDGYDLASRLPEGFDPALDEFELDYEEYELTFGDRVRAIAGRGLIRLGWLGLAAGLALGSAGIVAATEHSPSAGGRAELSYSGDKALGDKLDLAVRDLARLKDDVDSLGSMARKALASLSSVNGLALQDASDQGSNNLANIESASAALSKRLDCAGWNPATELEMQKSYSQPMIDRYQKVCVAIASVAPLGPDWDSIMSGSKTAMRVADDINTHDSLAQDALVLATQGRYQEAIDKLQGAAAAIDDATLIAQRLALVSDVSTLTQWMQRTKTMDDALRLLWQTMIDSGGKVNAKVTAALKAVSDAKALLPDSTGVLQVVMYELAGDLTIDGISIETARGALGDALADLTGGGTVFGG